MRSVIARVAAGLVLVGFATACSSDPTASEGVQFVGRHGVNVEVNPAEYMNAVGCTAVTGHADTGAVLIPLLTRPPARFNCRGVPADTVRAATQRYRDALVAAGGAMMSGYYEYYFRGARQYCWTEGHFGVEDGVAYFYIDHYNGCFWVESYDAVWVAYNDDDPPPEGGGGPGGGGWTGSPPPDPPPPNPDTCKAGDVIGSEPANGALAGQPGVMNSSDMVREIQTLYADARAATLEMGGYFYKETANGPILFERLAPDMTQTDACAFRADPNWTPKGAIVAYVHTHQAPIGIDVYCSTRHQTISPNAGTGGGSPQDWDKATAQNRPEYTVNAFTISRLDPGTPEGSGRETNSNRWDRVSQTSTACAPRRPL